MKTKTCCFAGHKDVYETEQLGAKIYDKCEELILKNQVNCFWVGNYGAFDKLCASIIRKLKKEYSHVELDLVVPYLTKEIKDYKEDYYKNYNYILIADIPEKTPKRHGITKCNEYMIDNSDYLIAYVNRSYGGAVRTLEHAQKTADIEIINFG